MLKTPAFQSPITQHGSAELLGHVHGISGSQATVGLLAAALNGPHRALITVGKFLKIQTGRALLVGVITDVSIQSAPNTEEQDYCALAHVDLIGEIERRSVPGMSFRRGVKDYPTIGDTVAPLTNSELRVIFEGSGAATISIGSLQQDSSVDACVEIDELLTKHFAVLGSTGVGKSSAIAHILLQMMQARPDLRIFLLDIHNEYDRCFGDLAYVANPGNLRLPFWLFNFEEIVDVFLGGRPGLQEEVDILAEVIPLAKANYTPFRSAVDGPSQNVTGQISYTVDTPVPYWLADLVTMIDERMGKLENRSLRMNYHKLITRIQSVSNDPRYAFMFENANVGGDTMAHAISKLFRIPADGKPLTIMQLAGFQAEVVDAVVSVLTRLAFDFGLWSNGTGPLLFVCEEAHKYASADRAGGFTPTRRAIARIAKEGRKYGVHLGLVTQRPAELDPTIISQCGTLFAMRMSNDRDQVLLRSAVSDAAANLFAFVPSLGTREALAFGAGIPLPTRLTFTELPRNRVPRSEEFASNSALNVGGRDLNYIASVLERWRSGTVNVNIEQNEDTKETTKLSTAEIPPRQGAVPMARMSDSNRLSLLKRPTVDQPAPSASLRRPAPIPSTQADGREPPSNRLAMDLRGGEG